MNISGIIVLLQLALSLLSNPQISSNPTLYAQANDFANQAIVLAQKSLTEQTTVAPTYTPPMPVNQTPTGGTPSGTISPAPVLNPSCSLTAKLITNPGADRPHAVVTWQTTDISDGTTGELYVGTGQSGGEITYLKVQDILAPSGTLNSVNPITNYFKAVFQGVECKTIATE